MDDHYQKNCGSISVCLEANERVVELLLEPPVAGRDQPRPSNGQLKGALLGDRQTWEHHVCAMSGESENTIVIAARTTVFESLEILFGKRNATKTQKYLSAKQCLHSQLVTLEMSSSFAAFMVITRQ